MFLLLQIFQFPDFGVVFFRPIYIKCCIKFRHPKPFGQPKYECHKADQPSQYKAFQHVETLFVQSRNLVPSRNAIGWQSLFTFRQPIAGLLGTRRLQSGVGEGRGPAAPSWIKRKHHQKTFTFLPSFQDVSNMFLWWIA